MSDLDIQIAGVASFWDFQMPGNAMEELAETIQAINKVERAQYEYTMTEDLRDKGKADEAWSRFLDRKEDLKNEIRDVYISIKALMHMYEISEEDIMERVYNKLNKKY